MTYIFILSLFTFMQIGNAFAGQDPAMKRATANDQEKDLEEKSPREKKHPKAMEKQEEREGEAQLEETRGTIWERKEDRVVKPGP